MDFGEGYDCVRDRETPKEVRYGEPPGSTASPFSHVRTQRTCRGTETEIETDTKKKKQQHKTTNNDRTPTQQWNDNKHTKTTKVCIGWCNTVTSAATV